VRTSFAKGASDCVAIAHSFPYPRVEALSASVLILSPMRLHLFTFCVLSCSFADGVEPELVRVGEFSSCCV
jgi:hypothetical protein